MSEKRLLCFARGRANEWEAICLDFDLAVQGRSFDEVRDLLMESVTTYVEDVAKEDSRTADRLLNRRAPLHVRTHYLLGWILHVLGGRHGSELQANFEIPCRA
jgi:hypothetical protein